MATMELPEFLRFGGLHKWGLEAPQGGSAQALATAVLAVLLWELAKRLWVWMTERRARTIPSLTEVPPEFKDLPVPPDPHFEMALHPPQGLHYSNSKEPWKWDNEYSSGTYLFFHPATGPNTQKGPDGFDYNEYFQCKSRLWELRMHVHFKRIPQDDEDLYFGIELDDWVPMSRATQQAQKVVVSGIRQAMGGMYHSPGDDKSKQGEREPPVCVLPLWAFDQYIITPEGEEPPKLWDADFPFYGSRRYRRIAEYAKEINHLKQNLQVGPTYTFAFWGNSRFLDILNWMVIGVPLVTPISFDKFAGGPPVHAVLYSLKKDPKDPRHLRSKKNYVFRAAVWSSPRRPERRRIESLTGELSHLSDKDCQSTVSSPTKQKTFQRRLAGFMRRFEECCPPLFQACGCFCE